VSTIAIIGGGPAGLMAAEILAEAGNTVTLYERMPSVGRKFLLAGRGGLNLTHSEGLEPFLQRYGDAKGWLEPFIKNLSPQDLRDWSFNLGEETFVGSSGRVFPKSFKTSPLLRAWLQRLDSQGVVIKTGHRWTGWSEMGALQFETSDGLVEAAPDATILALGGASWSRMGSDGAWVDILETRGVDISPLLPANCGFTFPWSDVMKSRFAGTPLKRIALTIGDQTVRGEAMLTEDGLEGGAVYALSAFIRNEAMAKGEALIKLDLRPDLKLDQMRQKLSRARGGDSFSNHLRKAVQLPPNAIALLREVEPHVAQLSDAALAVLIKALPLKVKGMRTIDRAISTAGGVKQDALDQGLMLRQIPSVFCAGEMLDWEAPTGGYLLQACFSSGKAAALSALKFLETRASLQASDALNEQTH
jgi:uncharacterized flavoprotein (TIGR03862 family)